MPIRPTLCLAACAALMLSACEDEPEVAVDNDGREASGEILEGTISDEMIPLDQIRSQPPLAVQTDAPGEDAGSIEADASDEDADGLGEVIEDAAE